LGTTRTEKEAKKVKAKKPFIYSLKLETAKFYNILKAYAIIMNGSLLDIQHKKGSGIV